MLTSNKTALRLAAVCALFLLTAVANAANANLSGNFHRDDEVVMIAFSVSQPGVVTIQTTSYAQGGFDPILTLFNQDGSLNTSNDDGVPGTVTTNPNTGYALDSSLTGPLDTGVYYVTVTQYDNVLTGPTLASGFSNVGQGNYTGGPFLDYDGNQMTGFWEVTITGDTLVKAEIVPEPGSIAFCAVTSLSLLGMFRRKRFGRRSR